MREKEKTFVKTCYFASVVFYFALPFYVYILLNALYFVLPAVISFVVGWLINRKNKQ